MQPNFLVAQHEVYCDQASFTQLRKFKHTTATFFWCVSVRIIYYTWADNNSNRDLSQNVFSSPSSMHIYIIATYIRF